VSWCERRDSRCIWYLFARSWSEPHNTGRLKDELGFKIFQPIYYGCLISNWLRIRSADIGVRLASVVFANVVIIRLSKGLTCLSLPLLNHTVPDSWSRARCLYVSIIIIGDGYDSTYKYDIVGWCWWCWSDFSLLLKAETSDEF
jgi:hypothetical protein